MEDSQDQILALAFGGNSLKRFKWFPLRSEADGIGGDRFGEPERFPALKLTTLHQH